MTIFYRLWRVNSIAIKLYVQVVVDVKSLKTIPLFSSLNRRQIGIVQACLQQISVPGGNAIIHQGQNNYDLYVITAGKACVFLRHEDGREVIIAPEQFKIFWKKRHFVK